MHKLLSKNLMMDKQILLGILMGTSHPILILDKESRIISISQKARDTFGYHEAGVLGKTFIDIIEPSYHSSLVSILNSNNNLTDENTFKFDCELLGANEDLFPVELSIYKVVQENEVNYVLIVKEQLQRLHAPEPDGQSLQMFQAVAEDSRSLIIVNDIEGITSYVNSRLQEYLGYEPQEIIGKNLSEIIHPEDLSLFNDLHLENQHVPFRLLNNEGNYELFSFSVQNIINKENRIVKRLITISSSGSKASLPVQQEHETLSTLTSILPDVFMKISRSGEVQEIFAGAPEDLLKPREEIIHNNIDNIFPASVSESIRVAIDAALEKKSIEICNYELVFPDNKQKQFDARVIPYAEDTVLAVIRNITEQVLSKQGLIEANEEAKKSGKLKDDFISVMSHEIRTPLNAVIGMTQLLIRKNPTEEQLELLNTIKFSGENLLKIINEILDFSKIKAEKVEFEEIDFNLRKLVKNNRLTHKNLASEKGLKFKLFIDDDVPEWIKGDYTKLNQILNNLISNAIKFTEEGTVSLDIYLESQTKGQVTLLFEVSDTGIGIPKDKLQHIFDPFHQASSSTSRKFGGTGLGLSIIKNMIELQKGRIEVESEEGKGSVFKVYLTFNKAPELIHNNPYSQNQQEISEYKIIKDLKILYVEDVESNQLLMQYLCKEWGVELEIVKDGFEAIEKVQSYRPHLILMDLQMPGMDGYEATEKIRALPDEYYQTLPIIALTAEVSESSKSKIKEVGMNDYLLKPIDTDELYGKLSLYSNLHEKMILESQRKSVSDNFYNYVNFSKTEELYKNDTLGFIKLLNLLVREFEGYHVQILKAVKEKDPKALSFVKHKVASTIQSFNLKELADLLVKLQHLITNEPNSLNEKELLEEIDNYFNEISNEFRIKIKNTSQITNKG